MTIFSIILFVHTLIWRIASHPPQDSPSTMKHK